MTEYLFTHKSNGMTSHDLPSPLPTHAPLPGTAPATALPRRNQRVTVFLPAPLLERLRNAVYWTAHRPLAQVIAHAVEDAVSTMELANGGAFPQRLAPLKAGRPRRSRSATPLSPSRRPPTERT